MRTQGQTKTITVRITDSITLDQREAAFLREMAKFCIERNMPGFGACCRLDDVLRAAGIPEYDHAPVYRLFEEE